MPPEPRALRAGAPRDRAGRRRLGAAALRPGALRGTWLGGDAAGESVLISAAWEVGGAILIGAVVGVPMAVLFRYIRAGAPTLAGALGAALLCGGLALDAEVSILLCAMTTGAIVAHVNPHHSRPFRVVVPVEWPLLILFFVLAGASLQLGALLQLGVVGAAYVGWRVVGRLLGARLGKACGGREERGQGVWLGLALLPHAGVALGLALVASERLPEAADVIVPVVVASTVLFELVGPVLTRLELVRAGEVDGG